LKTINIILAAGILVIAAGCENDGRSALVEQIDALKLEQIELVRQVEQQQAEEKRLIEQIKVLSGLDAEDRFENLYNLQKVEITGYTNLYDKNKDGKKEKLIVYLQPIDKEGDVVKATGAVEVQLWDLNKAGEKALLCQWQVTPAELKKLWFATIVTINYRLTFDVSDKVDSFAEPLTVKVTFTDYLTGRVFKEQKVIKP